MRRVRTFGFQSTSLSMGLRPHRMISTACGGKAWNAGGSCSSWCDFTSCVLPSSRKCTTEQLNKRSSLSGRDTTRTLRRKHNYAHQCRQRYSAYRKLSYPFEIVTFFVLQPEIKTHLKKNLFQFYLQM